MLQADSLLLSHLWYDKTRFAWLLKFEPPAPWWQCKPTLTHQFSHHVWGEIILGQKFSPKVLWEIFPVKSYSSLWFYVTSCNFLISAEIQMPVGGKEETKVLSYAEFSSPWTSWRPLSAWFVSPLHAGSGLALARFLWRVCVCSLSLVWFFVTLWTPACQVPLSARFPRKEYWSGLPFPSPEDLPNPEMEPMSHALAGGFFTTEQPEIDSNAFCIREKFPYISQVRRGWERNLPPTRFLFALCSSFRVGQV